MAKKVETNQTPERSPFKMAVQNLAFHNFEEQPKLVALFKDTVELGDEDAIDPKTGEPKTFFANVMTDLDTGEEKYVQNSYSIAKAIKTAKADYKDLFNDVVFKIEFLGKTTIKGKPFNQFKVGYCLLDEYEKFKSE